MALPSRNGHNGALATAAGKVDLNETSFRRRDEAASCCPIDEGGTVPCVEDATVAFGNNKDKVDATREAPRPRSRLHWNE